MKIYPTPIEGCILIEPAFFKDERGFFFESYNQRKFEEMTGHTTPFVQDNQSWSKKGVLRGLHMQKGSSAQTKLVRVLKGEVLDVAVDLRPGSKTFGQHHSVKLSEENFLQFLIPRGFAHGFVVLSEGAMFQYKCDNYYDRDAELGVNYADPELAIDWLFPQDQLIVATKDLELPNLDAIRDKL
ncbi:MAG: dTDP-4-dehydrorhamnose 3,5-epimerase [Bacteroidetes bacterium]|nr:dTDP-4-dehydrorhamnose 3,5-epimerase [Bacteroidota bacterium]